MAKKYANISPKIQRRRRHRRRRLQATCPHRIWVSSGCAVRVCVCVRGARYENIKNQFNEPFKQKYFYSMGLDSWLWRGFKAWFITISAACFSKQNFPEFSIFPFPVACIVSAILFRVLRCNLLRLLAKLTHTHTQADTVQTLHTNREGAGCRGWHKGGRLCCATPFLLAFLPHCLLCNFQSVVFVAALPALLLFSLSLLLLFAMCCMWFKAHLLHASCCLVAAAGSCTPYDKARDRARARDRALPTGSYKNPLG